MDDLLTVRRNVNSSSHARWGKIALGVVAVFASAAMSGCGGSSNGGNSAHIRAINVVPNGGDATFYVNTGAANGTQSFEQTSGYLYLQGGPSTITYILSNNIDLVAQTLTRSLSSSTSYTIALLGRADVATTATSYPKLLLLTDVAPDSPSGSAELRIVNAAPDSPATTVTYAGATLSTNLAYYGFQDYQAVPTSGTLSAGALASKSLNLKAGHAYTVFIDEPTIPSTASPEGTYDIYLVEDGA